MQRRISVLASAIACLALAAYAVGQVAFDRSKAEAAAKAVSAQVKQIRAQLASPPAQLGEDLRLLEGHADHLHSGLESGLDEDTTAPVLKRVVDLTLGVNEQAQTASLAAGDKQSLAALQKDVLALEALYGIDVASPAPKPPPPTVAKADPCKEKVQLTGIEFAFDSEALTPASDATLKLAADKLKKCEKIAVTIDGYTDSTGPARFNQQLSQKRADAVKAYLVTSGITAARLTAKGDGEADPIATNATIAGRAANRRVELTPAS